MSTSKRERERQTMQEDTLRSLGFTREEAEQLRRISNTLRNWFELECGNGNGGIERDEETGKPYWIWASTGKRSGTIPDREAGAMKRLNKIMSQHLPLKYYIQGDCRGATLYILRPGDIPEGEDAGAYYNRGICVY